MSVVNHRGLLDGWLVFEDGEVVEVMPRNDIRVHGLGLNCECDPEVVTRYGKDIISHNSFDGRELVEPLTTLLS